MVESDGSEDKMPVAFQDRYFVLEKAMVLLKLKQVSWKELLYMLRKSSDSCIDFDFGGMTVQFVRGFGVWGVNQNAIQLSIMPQGDVLKNVTFQYSFEELENLKSH